MNLRIAGPLIGLALAWAPSLAISQTGTFQGIVTRDTLDVRVPRAEIRLPAIGRTTSSDENGEFRINAVPAGRYLVTVRTLGFQFFTDTIEIRAAKILDAELTLNPSATRLDTLLTTAQSTTPNPLWWKKDFDDRRKAHITGSFLSDSLLRAHEDDRMISLITMLPGVRAVFDTHTNTSAVYIASGVNVSDGRPAFQASSNPCYMTVYVDGQKIFENNSTMEKPNFASLRVSDFAGVEVYPSSSTTPVQFSATGSSCGTVLLWRRNRF